MNRSASTITWITANQRLALHLHRQYDQTQQQNGKIIWETVDCLPLQRWITRTYQTLANAKWLLNEQQELILWEQIIAHSLSSELALLSPRSLAKAAQQAWRLLQQWETPLALLAKADSPEVQAFYQWATLFKQHCLQKNCVDFSICTTQVIAALSDGVVLPPNQCILAGFEEPSPQVQQLFALLAAQTQLKYYAAELPSVPTIVRVGIRDEQLELLAMAQWACKIQAEKPDFSIGCVVPALSTLRQSVVQLFSQTFSSPTLFNISGGSPFHYFPLVQSAFDILKLGIAWVDRELLSRLLQSPFVGGAEQEFTARAALDIKLLETLEPVIAWHSLRFFTAQQQNCSLWAAHCQRYEQCVAAAADYQTTVDWSQHFSQQLQAMGWPGERAIDSSEYQQIKRWHLLLEEFSHLEAVLKKPLSRSQALQHLYHLAQATVFQPQTTHASVQVLGVLEAVGLKFDCLWVVGMTQEQWPATASPNPFIPLALQRSRNMPHASAERELAYSRNLTQRFAQSATTVIFSYALQIEDRAQAPSALIVDFPEIALAELCPVEVAPEIALERKNILEYVLDEHGPAFKPEELLRGGSSVFKHQAACPFRAFVKLRLQAAKMPVTAFSLTAQERGTYLHAVLEQVWQVLRDHPTLCQYQEQALADLVKTSVANVLTAAAKSRVSALKPRFRALEQQRLTAQVMQWLQVEKQRPPFRVVALEAAQQLQFAGLGLKLRMDREDQLADGTRVLIDYKTGECSPASWFGERPDDPQLPLYGLTCDHPIGGLLFAQILAGKLQFAGLSEKSCDIAGVQTIAQQKWVDNISWEAFYAQQQSILTGLAQAFLAGYAKVDPYQAEKSCRYCDLQPLCRVDEGCNR